MMTQRVPLWLRSVQEHFVQGNRVVLLRNGAESYPAMLQAIASARRQVLLEMYWFGDGTIGRQFVDALNAAAGRGVDVAVLYDAFGSWETPDSLFEQMRSVGVRVLKHNPIRPWRRRFRLARLTKRDHRKILTADGVVGFTGGINIADPWLPEEEGGKGWRDDMVRLEGPAVGGLVEYFRRTWRRQRGEPLPTEDDQIGGEFGSQRVRVLGDERFRNRLEIHRAYLVNIHRARRRVWIANSYFVPDRPIVRALVRAALRGVDVRVIVPGVSDIEVVRHASRAVWGRLMRHGVRIYEWTKNMLHTKSAVIDGRWSTIGTFNINYWSLMNNLEVNVGVLDEGFGAEMEASFERDFAVAREVDFSAFRFRSLQDRLLDSVLYSLRRLL